VIRHVLAAAAFTASVAQAQDFDGVVATSLLSDSDFFRLATCGAPPGGDCKETTLRWGRASLTVALMPGETPSEARTATRISPELDRAIDRINQVGSGLTLRRIEGPDADIRVQPTDLPEGTALSDVPGFSAPGIMGVGYVSLWANDADEITNATILFSTDISDDDLRSVVLEELFQSLGPRFDIEGPAYEGVSILSQTSNATLDILGQDAALLRWLYP
jgi:hypothetical protein